jgi:hypothetical protein
MFCLSLFFSFFLGHFRAGTFFGGIIHLAVFVLDLIRDRVLSHNHSQPQPLAIFAGTWLLAT